MGADKPLGPRAQPPGGAAIPSSLGLFGARPHHSPPFSNSNSKRDFPGNSSGPASFAPAYAPRTTTCLATGEQHRRGPTNIKSNPSLPSCNPVWPCVDRPAPFIPPLPRYQSMGLASGMRPFPAYQDGPLHSPSRIADTSETASGTLASVTLCGRLINNANRLFYLQACGC